MYIHSNVKKYGYFVLFAVITAVFPLAADGKKTMATTLAREGTLSGDFVIYRDYSWKNPTWIGFLYYNDNTYGAVLHTPATNTRVAILFSCEATHEKLELVGQKMISPITPEDTAAVNYLMTLLPKLYANRMLPHHTSGIFASGQKKMDDYEFGGAVTLHFDNYIPLFHLKTLTNNAKGIVLELMEFGTIQSNDEPLFYSYTPSEPVQAAKKPYTLTTKRKKEPVTLYGATLQLDDQWQKIADNSFLCGDTAFLTVTPLAIPATDETSLKPQVQLLRYFLSSSPMVKVLYPYTRISGTESQFTIEQSVYDVKMKKLTKDIKRCIKNKDDSYLVVSLTVDSNVYSRETEYFHGLFPFF